ncbi:MAG: transcriptional repressor [Parvularculaceae bacterium]
MGFYGLAARAADETRPRSRPEKVSASRPLSRNEELVYGQLLKAGGPLKAYALLDQLHDEGLRAPMTIYRALDSLIGRGSVRKIASLNAFVALTPDIGAEFGAFVTCTRCGSTRSIGIQRQVVEALLVTADMAISEVYIEAFGDCDGGDCCQAAAAGAPA